MDMKNYVPCDTPVVVKWAAIPIASGGEIPAHSAIRLTPKSLLPIETRMSEEESDCLSWYIVRTFLKPLVVYFEDNLVTRQLLDVTNDTPVEYR